jgi:AbrB family looped-hinge helix DNA binding protein
VVFGGSLSRKEATFTVYVREDGKVTVPKGVRDSLGIEKGDLVECKIRKVKGAKK